MMLDPAMKDLLKQVPSRYMLVNVVAHRARQIASQADDEGYPLEEKPVTLALNEVAAGQVDPADELCWKGKRRWSDACLFRDKGRMPRCL